MLGLGFILFWIFYFSFCWMLSRGFVNFDRESNPKRRRFFYFLGFASVPLLLGVLEFVRYEATCRFQTMYFPEEKIPLPEVVAVSPGYSRYKQARFGEYWPKYQVEMMGEFSPETLTYPLSGDEADFYTYDLEGKEVKGDEKLAQIKKVKYLVRKSRSVRWGYTYLEYQLWNIENGVVEAEFTNIRGRNPDSYLLKFFLIFAAFDHCDEIYTDESTYFSESYIFKNAFKKGV